MADLGSPEGMVPPHSLESEQALLGATMTDPGTADRLRALDLIADLVRPEHFYSEAHRRIFEAQIALRAEGKPVDSVIVATWLRGKDRLGQVGGMSYLAQCLGAAPSILGENVRAYAETVVEKYRVRQVIHACQIVAAKGYLDYGDAQDFIDGASAKLHEIARTAETTTLEPIAGVLTKTTAMLNKATAEGHGMLGMATGFRDLDALLGGLHDGDLTIIAARPGIGKTSLALNIAENVALQGYDAAVFSMEMPREQLGLRAACSRGRVNLGELRQGQLGEAGAYNFNRAVAELARLPIWIDDRKKLTVHEVAAKIRRVQAAPMGQRGRVRLVVLDYLQLMRATKRAESQNRRELEVSEIAQDCKDLAGELKLPVIALSQLSRAGDARPDKGKKPQLSDLRESGNIEQAADNIGFITDGGPIGVHYEGETTEHMAKLHWLKQRNGPQGVVKLKFLKASVRFENYDGDERGDE